MSDGSVNGKTETSLSEGLFGERTRSGFKDNDDAWLDWRLDAVRAVDTEGGAIESGEDGRFSDRTLSDDGCSRDDAAWLLPHMSLKENNNKKKIEKPTVDLIQSQNHLH